MKIYACIKSFKTTLFDDKVERIEINEGTDWFLAKKLSEDRVILSNNKIEINIAKEILIRYFKQWG